ncbi:MAG TPA: AAA family ATPase [Terriglobales bacterium]
MTLQKNMRPEISNSVESGLHVITICLNRETAEKVKTATLREHGTFVGELQGYSLREGELQALLQTQNAEVSVCVIDFDQDRVLAGQAANSINRMLHGRTTLIALSEKADPNLIVEAMRAGCSEYLSKPLTVEQVCESLTRLCGRIEGAREVKTSGKTLVFLGCRGGAGATTLAVHLGSYLASPYGKKTLIVDQHQHLGHVALYLGQDTLSYDFYELVRNVARLDQTLLAGFVAHHASGVDILPGPCALNGHINVSLDAVERSIRFLANVYEYAIVDCAPGLSDLNLATIDCCDELYLVATPDVPSLRDLSKYLDRLAQCNVAPCKLKVVLNRYGSDSAVTLEQIEKAIRRPVSITVPNSHADLMRAMNTGTPVSPDRRTDFTTQMKKWAASLLPLTPEMVAEEPKRRFSLWR